MGLSCSVSPGTRLSSRGKGEKKAASEESRAVFWEGKGWRPLPLPIPPFGRFFSQFYSVFSAIQVPSTAEAGPWLVQSSKGALRSLAKTKLMKKRQEHITRMNKWDNVL